MGMERRSRASDEPSEKPEITRASLLGGLDRELGPLVKINQLPRKPETKDLSAEEAKEILQEVSGKRVAATLVGSYHAGESVLLAWVKVDRGSPVGVYTGGESLVGEETRGDDRILNYPAGAEGQEVASAELDTSLRGFTHWKRIHATRPPASKSDLESGKDAIKEIFGPELSLENNLLKTHHGPFVYLLHAAPIPPEKVEDLRVKKEMETDRAKSYAESSSENKIMADVFEDEQKELALAKSLGLWDVSLLVGAKNEREVNRIAGTVAASAMRGNQIFIPEKKVLSLEEALDTSQSDSPDRFQSTTESLAGLFSYPKTEIPGVLLVARPDFDVNVEQSRTDDNSGYVRLGTVMDNTDFPAGEFKIPVDSLTSHMLIGGITGFGKSETTRTLLEELSEKRVTWTVLEPGKSEYRVMGARLAGKDLPDQYKEVAVIRPGDSDLDSIPGTINPLAPVPGFPLKVHVGNVRSVFANASGGDAEGLEIVKRYLRLALHGSKKRGIEDIYKEKGLDLKTGKSFLAGGNPKYPELADLEDKMDDIVEKLGYGEEVSDNMRGYMGSKLGSLRTGAPGEFLEGGHPIDMSRLLSTNTVIELEGVKDGDDLSFIMSLILISAREQLEVDQQKRDTVEAVPLRHVFVVEEAHHLFRKASEGQSSDVSDRLANLIAEIRAYGVGIVLVDQIPSKLNDGAIRNSRTKVLHATPAKEDRDAVGETMNLDDAQSKYVTRLDKGEVVAFSAGMDHPVLARISDPKGKPKGKNEVIKPHKIIERRHGGACGAECQSEACSIRQISRANDFIDTEAGRVLTAWADFAVVGELLGLGDIKPDEQWNKEKNVTYFDNIKELDTRTRECAVGTVVTAAVNNRALDIESEHSLEEFTSYITKKLNAQLNGEKDTGEDKGKFALRSNHRMNTSLLDKALGLSFQDAEKADAQGAWMETFNHLLNSFEIDEHTRTVFTSAYSNPSQSMRKEPI